MITKDDTAILEILANSETTMRQRLIELINAGANSATLYSFVGAIGSIENAGRNSGDEWQEDE